MESVIIDLQADSSKLNAALDATIDKLEQTGAVTKEQAEAFKSSQTQMAASVNTTVVASNNLGESFKNLNKNIAGGALKQATQDIKTVGEETDKTTTKTGSLRREYTQMVNELAKLRVAGKEGTEQYRALQTEAAKLGRELIETRGSVRSLSEEFGSLKAGAEAIRGVNAAMEAGVGISSLFGTENEEAEKSIKKMMGVMLIANGIQEASNLLKADSIVRLKAQATWTYGLAAAEEFFANASAAAWAVALGGITLVAGAVAGLIFAYKNLTGETENYKDEVEKLNNQTEIEVALMKQLISVSETLGFETLAQKLELANKQYDRAGEALHKLVDGYKEANTDLGGFTFDEMVTKGGDAWKKLTKEQQDELEKQLKIQEEAGGEIRKIQAETSRDQAKLIEEYNDRVDDINLKGFAREIAGFQNQREKLRVELINRLELFKEEADKEAMLNAFDDQTKQQLAEINLSLIHI